MTKAFTSSNPDEVRRFCSEPMALPGRTESKSNALAVLTTFTASEAAALRASNEMALRALDDLRTELAEARADRDRAWKRVQVLESRLSAIRLVVR